ncbi:hypothetical protein [Aliidiomarina quisquiliarum]|uniref:hypothetical protein n=1 Tax=Aliidiomarina quisquiliarum TaxID=2938947 RepID=UPI00208F33A1|nr:hypothetical protein [Aliidiomarina quisquiliarum]MCO4319965.1 hypothetical protein [Aliidiomarina quisquiliarum]
MQNVDEQWSEIKSFLDDIRASGLINPLGAAPSLMADFGLTRKEAGHAVQKWMRSFDNSPANGVQI